MASFLLHPLPTDSITIVFIFLLGTIIGSFLNVFIYRLHTGKSLSGHSHCLSCGERLAWYDLFPLFSYIFLKARCRTCGCTISARYFWVELVSGFLFVSTLMVTTVPVFMLFWWVSMALLVVIAVYDLYHYIIPDELTLALTVLIFINFLVGDFLVMGSFDLGKLGLAVTASLGGVLFFFCLWFFSSGRWVGFGDVKLAFPLGLLVGPALVFSYIVLSFWIGAVLSLSLLFYQLWQKRGKKRLPLQASTLTIKSAVPFAPFLIAGSLVALFWQVNVLELFS